MIKFQASVKAVGPLVSEFLDHQILVLFGMNAPPELAEFAVLHDGAAPAAPLRRGDRLWIDGSE